MKVGEMFPSKYLTATDLAGKTYILTIRAVREERVRRQGGKEEAAYVVYFQNAQKGLILCKTSAHQMAEVCGNEDSDLWTGMKVALYPEETTVGGQKRMAVRVRRVGTMTPAVGDPQPGGAPLSGAGRQAPAAAAGPGPAGATHPADGTGRGQALAIPGAMQD